MKTIIFSDAHLTNRFDEPTYRFLENMILSADKIIINGDFWDGEVVSFNQFINSKWQKLFPLLLERKAVYIYGNHDRAIRSNDNVSLFSIEQTKHYRLPVGDKILVVEHGDIILPFDTEEDEANGKHSLIVTIVGPFYPLTEKILAHLFGRNFFKVYRVFNNAMKKYAAKNLEKNEILVTGHTHCAEFSPEKKYINNGLIRHGVGQYLLVENDTMRLIDENY